MNSLHETLKSYLFKIGAE